LSTRGFVDELGRELARKLFSKFSLHDKPCEILILGEDFQIVIIIPANLNQEESEKLLFLLNEFIKGLHSHTYITVIYDKNGDKFVQIT